MFVFFKPKTKKGQLKCLKLETDAVATSFAFEFDPPIPTSIVVGIWLALTDNSLPVSLGKIYSAQQWSQRQLHVKAIKLVICAINSSNSVFRSTPSNTP
jgi:hypothetical protein